MMRAKGTNKLVRRACVLWVAVVLLCINADARPLAQYVADLDQSGTELRQYVDGTLDLDNPEVERSVELVLQGIRKRLPASEEVEIDQVTVEVDNSWLNQDIEAFESEREPKKKKTLLLSIKERLDALYLQASRVPDLERRESSKDEEKQRLSEILKREEYSIAGSAQESPAARFYRFLMDWLRSLIPDAQPVAARPGADMALLQSALQVLVFLLALGLVVYVIIRFGPLILRRYKTERRFTGKKLILGEEIAADATTEDLYSEAERLALSGDIRGAIRKGYISLLFELSERRLISLKKHKTNRDYLRDLWKHQRLRSNVGGLTQNYERTWYGNRKPVDEDWDRFKSSYRDTLDS